MTSENFLVYRFETPTKVKLIKTIADFNGENLITGEYYDGSFYVTSLNKLYRMDYLSLSEDFNVTSYKVNGTCEGIHIYQSTIHLSCIYDKLPYVVELLN